MQFSLHSPLANLVVVVISSTSIQYHLYVTSKVFQVEIEYPGFTGSNVIFELSVFRIPCPILRIKGRKHTFDQEKSRVQEKRKKSRFRSKMKKKQDLDQEEKIFLFFLLSIPISAVL